MKRVRLLLLLSLLPAVGFASSVFQWMPAPLYKPAFGLDAKEPNTYLRFLNLNGEVADVGKVGTKVPLLGYGPVQFSTLAFIRIWMYPVDMKFNVDRFLAALGLGFDFRLSPWVYGLFSPLYHESAHLADGHPGDVEADKRTVSVESFQLRMWYEKGVIQIPFRADWYWHVIGPHWKYNIGSGFRLALPVWNLRAGQILLEISGFGTVVNEAGTIQWNGEFEEGLLFRNGDRKLRLGFYYGYEYGPGQDWRSRQRGWGLDLGFAY